MYCFFIGKVFLLLICYSFTPVARAVCELRTKKQDNNPRLWYAQNVNSLFKVKDKYYAYSACCHNGNRP